ALRSFPPPRRSGLSPTAQLGDHLGGGGVDLVGREEALTGVGLGLHAGVGGCGGIEHQRVVDRVSKSRIRRLAGAAVGTEGNVVESAEEGAPGLAGDGVDVEGAGDEQRGGGFLRVAQVGGGGGAVERNEAGVGQRKFHGGRRGGGGEHGGEVVAVPEGAVEQ